jgi:plasmid stability protein
VRSVRFRRCAVVIELPEELEAAVKVTANAKGVSPETFVRELVERAVEPAAPGATGKPLKSGRGMLAQFGAAPTAEEIDANAAEMFRTFGESF